MPGQQPEHHGWVVGLASQTGLGLAQDSPHTEVEGGKNHSGTNAIEKHRTLRYAILGEFK